VSSPWIRDAKVIESYKELQSGTHHWYINCLVLQYAKQQEKKIIIIIQRRYNNSEVFHIFIHSN